MANPIVRLGEIKMIVGLQGQYKGKSCIVYADNSKEIVTDKRANEIAKMLAAMDQAAHNLRDHREHGKDPKPRGLERLNPEHYELRTRKK